MTIDERLPPTGPTRTLIKSSIMPNENETLTQSNKSNGFTADDYIYRARLAEKALRYEDMLNQMRRVLELKKKLTADERNLLVVAYKNAVTTRRTGVCKEFSISITKIYKMFFLSSHSTSFSTL